VVLHSQEAVELHAVVAEALQAEAEAHAVEAVEEAEAEGKPKFNDYKNSIVKIPKFRSQNFDFGIS